MAMTLRVVVPPHPLIAHWLTVLRHRHTPSPLYGTALQELGRWLTYEAIRDWLPHRPQVVTTATGEANGSVIESTVPLLACPILPAGLELWQGARSVLPEATLCLSVPDQLEHNAGLILFVDQISNGEREVALLKRLMAAGIDGRRVRLITALTASPGLKLIGETIQDLTLHTACIDPDLTEDGKIRPGIGDPVQRLKIRINSPD